MIKRITLPITVFKQEFDMPKIIHLFMNLEILTFTWSVEYPWQPVEAMRFQEFQASMRVYKKENPECRHPEIFIFERPLGWK